ncbi:sentrin-specific protease 1-like [Hylaeus anthracinus]|uniref:sentrin-specific protease 1-like n=1 Tax=Hylaeus anthracinus TaxID=313031 RepID=UPI0023B9C640|nr:sentrin-specific protease 1-like [Hylaeus anthracinus]XP_054001164.1 sentrin-specific protease 1-like [Hylaeus anthracinus]
MFSFIKRLFEWVDEASRKRRAASVSIEKEFVTPKKHCCDYKTANDDEESIEIKDDSDSDDVQIVTNRKQSPIKSSSRLNGSCSSREEPFTCYGSHFSMSKPDQCYDKLSRVQNGTHQRCPTLTNTHRLREKSQYDELLQNFLPRRIDVICTKHEEKVPTPEVVEIIDIEKSGSSTPKPQQMSEKYGTTLQMHWNTHYREKKNKDKKDKIVTINLDNDKKDMATHSICDQTQSNKKNVSIDKSVPSKCIKSVATNSLRDQLAARAIFRNDFVPQTTKRYNERIERRYKEAEELKKLTYMLSRHNRLAREAALEEQLAQSMKLCEAVLDESEEPDETLPTLTKQMLQDVKNALFPRPPDEVLVEGFGLRITRKDIHTLADLNWLNDEVINFYMNLLIARSSNDKYPKVHAMNTFFYPKLVTGGHASLKRWTRKIDIFAQDLVVVPVHLGVHWCMSIIDFRDKSIRYYDSMCGSNSQCLSALRQYLEDESLDKKKQHYDTSNWKLECVKNIPQQMNGSDCGVFSCMFAEYICANRKITFTQDDMPYFRNKMVYEILTSKLL